MFLVVLLSSFFFSSCSDNDNIVTVEDVQNLELIVQNSQITLGKNLMHQINNFGTAASLDFCNVNAVSLLDSVSKSFDVNIKRVSDLNRNENNLANTDELSYILQCKELLNSGKKLAPLIEKKNNHLKAYFPITTNNMCLQCHGKNIEPTISHKLDSLYPLDKAIGYDINQIRGIWVIKY
ncbi:MAG: DUF3365 domain-containing protein [Flavobacteriaceae bacterium]|jgi:hypothetical protein|nr:DUF3365 domain-containing protein [Flavobacteriaceae bacterium]|tara:strand:+ start:131 stop:670 length:540 start_codon:yes stop_codon:yes gene_type:complete